MLRLRRATRVALWVFALSGVRVPVVRGDDAPITPASAYGRAIATFRRALRQRDTSPEAPEWRKALGESLPLFEQTAADFTSEDQDVAWVYVVRVAYELGDWDGVATSADRASAFWESPASKRPAAEEPKFGSNRWAQQAAVAYWRAAALVGSKRDDAALTILERYEAEHGADPAFYLGWAMGLRIEILLRQQKYDAADPLVDELVRVFPGYYRLSGILVQLADFYRAEEREIQNQVDDVATKKRDALSRRSKATETLARLTARIAKLRRIIDDSTVKSEREAAVLALRDALAELKSHESEVERLTAEHTHLKTRMSALVEAQVVSLRRTTGRFRTIYYFLKDHDAKSPLTSTRPRMGLVPMLALHYYNLAKLDDTDVEAWNSAKRLYDEWLRFPEVETLPYADASKRRVYRMLGEIDVRVAATLTSREEQRRVYRNAVRFLEDGLARVAAEQPILLGILSGELVVSSIEYDGRQWKIPLRRTANLQEFREYVRDLFLGHKLPITSAGSELTHYGKAVFDFQEQVASASDAELTKTVARVNAGGLDMGFVNDHSDLSPPDFLLLARAYHGGERAGDGTKAINALRFVMEGPRYFEDDSADWWGVQTLALAIRVSIAERALESGGAASEAKQATIQAQMLIKYTKQSYPGIGGADRRHKTIDEWTALQARIAELAKKLGLPFKPVELTAR